MNARLGHQFSALTTLAEIDKAILSRLDVDGVLEIVVAQISNIVNSAFVSVAILDDAAPGMMRIYTRGEFGDAHSTMSRGACPAEDALELLAHPSGMSFTAAASSKSYALPVLELGAQAIFACPIIWQERVVGILVLGFHGSSTSLTSDERALTRDLGDRIGVAFASAA